MNVEEVHLWRGSVEQQALRSQSVKTSQFAYFDKQLDRPDWAGKSVLDFGGNRGNILQDPSCRIDRSSYYCLDVIKEAIDEGRKTFPDAHWFHYDRYNCSFNPTGIANLAIPDFERKFDVILAYSVFTHTTLEEMTELVSQLEARLAPGGTFAFTFIDPHWNGNLKWRLQRVNGKADVEQSVGARWCALVNDELFIENNGRWVDETEPCLANSCLTYHVFYTEEFLRELFPRAIVRPPVNGEMQHCCIIRK